MSDARTLDPVRVPAWTRPTPRHFTATALGTAAPFMPWAEEPDEAAPPLADAEAILAEGYAIGLEEGRRAAEEALADERAALAQLAHAIETLRPEPPAALSALLAETVRRLVAQIVGEAAIDPALLAERTHAIAALIADEAAPRRLRLHPDDIARLDGIGFDVEIVADPALDPGTILAETGAGWIEDGPAIRLEKLRTTLDRMGCPR